MLRGWTRIRKPDHSSRKIALARRRARSGDGTGLCSKRCKLAFCDKRTALSTATLTPIQTTGFVLTLAGLIGQFYFVGYH